MPYDSNLDEKLFAEVQELGETRITVAVFSYNQGQKKLQLSRENNISEEEWRFAKLGRLTKEEVEGILPSIQKALEAM